MAKGNGPQIKAKSIELDRLFQWKNFYDLNRNKKESRKAWKQIKKLRAELKELRDHDGNNRQE